MWFKNLHIYKLSEWDVSFADLQMQLARGTFAGCPATQASARGWVQPTQDSGLAYAQDSQWLIALATAERLLPGDIVKSAVANLADKATAESGFPPGRKALRELKERAIQELLPKAFVRTRVTYAWLDRAGGYLVIDTGSQARAEAVIEHLRHTLDEFPLAPLHTNVSPTSAMADWLAGGAPAGFTVDRDCRLTSIGDDRASVAYAHHPLEGDEILEHLAAGKLPTKLALTWDDRLSFVLTDHLVLKRLAFLDVVKEAASGCDVVDQFDADFAIMTGELRRFIPSLVKALGGEVVKE